MIRSRSPCSRIRSAAESIPRPVASINKIRQLNRRASCTASVASCPLRSMTKAPEGISNRANRSNRISGPEGRDSPRLPRAPRFRRPKWCRQAAQRSPSCMPPALVKTGQSRTTLQIVATLPAYHNRPGVGVITSGSPLSRIMTSISIDAPAQSGTKMPGSMHKVMPGRSSVKSPG